MKSRMKKSTSQMGQHGLTRQTTNFSQSQCFVLFWQVVLIITPYFLHYLLPNAKSLGE